MAYAKRKDALKALKKHYQENKQYYLDKKKKYWNETHTKVNELKNVPCVDCKKTFPPYCMDFDHRDGREKEYNISTQIRRGTSFKKILLEILKCDIVCAVCHRIRTHNRYSTVV